ncbi:flavin reductase family protein [Alkalihalobacillus sp. AL-G]|uniref:flavin reductase family protein n=1 Tax=Alkalihalobacillus sp. AL-G TaxID=2926399 RepID=UPI00272CD362|nr:flavin reductase family protein [Alkalihalobacillus sp. AL-G]WLD94718.1 flavin reductase family protein [Alkalihalobacillus sp. AL-G]
MRSIDPNTLTSRDNYKFLTGSIIPRPVAFVTTLSEKGVLNGAPFSYFNIVSSDPPMISVSVQRKKGKQKDTARNAIFKGEFVVHITDESYVEQVNKTAASLPFDESEVKEAGLSPVKSKVVVVPGVNEAKIRFECRLEHAIELGGDDDDSTCDLLIGRVVSYHILDELYEEGRIDGSRLKPVSRLAGNNYAKLGEVFSLKRPK